MSRAMHQIDRLAQILLVVDARMVMMESGHPMTFNQFADLFGMKTRKVRAIVRAAKDKLTNIL